MRFLRRENVKDSTANADLSARFDHVGALVSQFGQSVDKIRQVNTIPDFDAHDFNVSHTSNNWLEKRADRDNKNRKWTRMRIACNGMNQPAEHSNTTGHRVDLR